MLSTPDESVNEGHVGEAEGSGGVSGGASGLRRPARSRSAAPAAPSEYEDETAPRAPANAAAVTDAVVAVGGLIFLNPLFKFLLGRGVMIDNNNNSLLGRSLGRMI